MIKFFNFALLRTLLAVRGLQLKFLAVNGAGGWVRVLIVDDQAHVRRGLRAWLLGAKDISVCGEASDGWDAVNKALQLKPDVILMDINMPGLNGLEATREIRRVLPEIQVVILSLFDFPQLRKEAVKAGAAAYVGKSQLWAQLGPVLQNVQAPDRKTGLADANGAPTTAEKWKHVQAFQKALHEIAAGQLQAFTKQVAAPMTRCSRDLRYLWVNQRYADWLERPVDEIVGRRIVDVIGSEAFQAIEHRFDQALTGAEVTYEEQVRYDRIGLRHISAVYRPTFDLVGTTDGWVALVQDITEKTNTALASD